MLKGGNSHAGGCTLGLCVGHAHCYGARRSNAIIDTLFPINAPP